VLFGTSPFVDLAKIEMSRNGLAQFRHAIFGRVLGDVPVDGVRARAREMAEDVLEFLKA
jgi:hypothetical protein